MSKDINVTDGTVLETLNNKVDIDGGNYPGSGLEEYIHEHCGGSGLQPFDTILKDHILTYEESKGLALQGTYVYKEAIAGSRYGYPDFYAKCLEEKNAGTATEVTLAGTTITMYIYSNGHAYYDIADKPVIDTCFSVLGMAWWYGIDTENERVFLPRNNWFEQATADISEINTHVEAGLPNITGHLLGNQKTEFGSASGAFKLGASRGGNTAGYSAGQYSEVYFDASRSNPIYSNSDTVQPNAVKKLLYICVGNTEKQSSVTDVVNVTTTENDTIPLGYSTYQDGTQPSISWLKSEGQWNSGKGYTTFYNWAVNKLGQTFASGYIKEYTDEYDDYDLVINQDDITFRLPLLDGSESIVSDRTENLNIVANGGVYTAPANGWYTFVGINQARNNSTAEFITGAGLRAKCIGDGATATSTGMNVPVSKGETCTFWYFQIDITSITFTYAKGNGSLYFKVANAVQNLELLDAGKIEEQIASLIPNNSSLIANYAMPSSKYINLTFGASGTKYTAPANGWVYIQVTGTSTAYNLGVSVGDSLMGFGQTGTFNGYDIGYTIPVAKGMTFGITYANVSKKFFKFIYAQDSESEV